MSDENPLITAFILAAGEGKRMRTRTSKVLQPLAGQAMIDYVIQAVQEIEYAQPVIIYGHQGEVLKEYVSARYNNIFWAEQAEQLGTGHAVQQGHQFIKDGIILVLLGDVPLIKAETLRSLIKGAQQTGFALLTTFLDQPHGYGRVIRHHDGTVLKIVEEKDANDDERSVKEVNSGIMAFSAEVLKKYLPLLRNHNAQGEYYLTDLVALYQEDGRAICATIAENSNEVMGINDRLQLATATRVIHQQRAHDLMMAGATLIDPDTVYIDGTIQVGRDVIIAPNVHFLGDVVLADGVHIESNCVISHTNIAHDAVIHANSCLENSTIGEEVSIGPFARIRPNSVISHHARIGNFVETKAAEIGEGSKVNHLSYIGDTTIGTGVNIGAGTITCNYDGVNKFKTIIHDGAFIGSNTALVAPITIGKQATIGAGSTITKDVNDNALAVARGKMCEVIGWQRPKKIKKS